MFGRISEERLVSVDANSRRGGFLPATPKFCGFSPSLPPQNAAYYPITRRQKQAESFQGNLYVPCRLRVRLGGRGAAGKTRKALRDLKKSLRNRKKSSFPGKFACKTFKIRL